jgi:hypothetical protein
MGDVVKFPQASHVTLLSFLGRKLNSSVLSSHEDQGRKTVEVIFASLWDVERVLCAVEELERMDLVGDWNRWVLCGNGYRVRWNAIPAEELEEVLTGKRQARGFQDI